MKIAIIANINGRYISAEYGGGISDGIALTANREAMGVYEIFEEEDLGNGLFALKTDSGNYVTADINGLFRTNMLEVGAWEQFRWDESYILTHHNTRLTAYIEKELIPIEQTTNRDIWEQFTRVDLEPINKREGLVTYQGKAVKDFTGSFHPLGLTFFWALYGWKHERERIYQHLDWMKQFNFDYLRILGEVDWEGRSILPEWPDYQQVLAEFVDCAYDQYGLRTELTIIGGKYRKGIENKVVEALKGRENKIAHYEVANEWERLDKISREDLIRVGSFLRSNTPNLVALSTPKDKYDDMIQYTRAAGVNMFTLHTRRSDHDVKWSHVRQGYDLKNFPFVISNNEPQGPQSSVKTLDNPMQLAMARATGIVCNGAFYVLHVGQGVTGLPSPNYGRPANMWEVPNIDNIMRHVRQVDSVLPEGIENWKCVNNGRDDHPMPLDPDLGEGFWEGDSDGSVNKNFACINGDSFVEVLLGVNNENSSGITLVGNPIRDTTIVAHDINDYSVAAGNVAKGGQLYLEGRKDKMKGYVVHGNL
jgi:hypothetical protein